MTPLSWEHWIDRFQNRGYRVITPGWPGIEGHTEEEIRREPSALNGVGVTEIAGN
jgi:hypothetical protein